MPLFLLSRHEQALKQAEAALADEWLSCGSRLAMQRRVLSLGLPAEKTRIRMFACLCVQCVCLGRRPAMIPTILTPRAAGKPPWRWKLPRWRTAAQREPPEVRMVGRPLNRVIGATADDLDAAACILLPACVHQSAAGGALQERPVPHIQSGCVSFYLLRMASSRSVLSPLLCCRHQEPLLWVGR